MEVRKHNLSFSTVKNVKQIHVTWSTGGSIFESFFLVTTSSCVGYMESLEQMVSK